MKAVRCRTSESPSTFEEKIAWRKRFSDLAAGHTTAVIIGASDAEALLDLAAHSGLYALLEVKVRPEDLFSRRALRAALADLQKRVTGLRDCPSVIGYLLDCPLPPDALRLHGLDQLRGRLARMITAIRAIDGRRFVGLKHHPGTMGLTLAAEDFVYAVMPPLTAGELRSAVIRLHNLAEARPVIVEFVAPPTDQDEFIAYAFALGAAGIVAPAPGQGAGSKPLVDNSLALKMLTASELPFLALNGSCPPKPAWLPKVSVVICAYNAARTLRPCLESLGRLDYPNFEVIIVDDGSQDTTAQIAADFPQFRLIRQANRGLSAARNVGMHAAVGELIAYTDSDCVVDSDWLSFMVRAMAEGGLDGCGGPNYAPHEDGRVEACVAAAPGAPCHVLLGDDRAEHLAGCNMLFRKKVLEDVGGFDSQFTAAGDDVDICWRLLDAGYALGYCPSAFVWHFRRNTVRAYYRQQRGYGKAEALLYLKYPARFNLLGQIKWNGIIPGVARTFPGGGRRCVQWVRSTKQFQRVTEVPLSLLKVAPLTAEWSVTAAALLVLSLFSGITTIPALAALAAGPLWAMFYASRAPLEKSHRCLASRLLIGWLAYSGSLARTLARYRCRAAARQAALFSRAPRQQPVLDWKHCAIRLSYWNSVYATRERVLEQLGRFFAGLGRPVVSDNGWTDFDLLVETNPWTRIQFRTAEEELGGLELKTNVAARLRLSVGACTALLACVTGAAAAFALGSTTVAVAGCFAVAVATMYALGKLVEAGHLAYRAVEQCASELDFVPLGKPLSSAGIPSVVTASDPVRHVEAAEAR